MRKKEINYEARWIFWRWKCERQRETYPSGGGLVSDSLFSVLGGFGHVIYRLFHVVLNPVYHFALAWKQPVIAFHEVDSTIVSPCAPTFGVSQHPPAQHWLSALSQQTRQCWTQYALPYHPNHHQTLSIPIPILKLYYIFTFPDFCEWQNHETETFSALAMFNQNIPNLSLALTVNSTQNLNLLYAAVCVSVSNI